MASGPDLPLLPRFSLDDFGKIPFATALKRSLKEYSAARLRADVMAGIVVGVLALPLSMALGIAVGVAPQNGLYTAVIAGVLVALTGGSKFQITGPTAAFVVILAKIFNQHGLAGLLTAGMMAGVLLLAMGVARLGRLIQFIPHPVTTGFTAGIATVIATLQLKDVFALPIAKQPDGYVEKWIALFHARASASYADALVALATVVGILLLSKKAPGLTKRLPAPLLVISLLTVLAAAAHHFLAGFQVVTIGSRFSTTINGHTYAGIPPLPPTPMIPWAAKGMSLDLLRQLFPAAFAIAMLGAIESLLSAVIADGMTGKKHDPDAELVALGIGNIAAPFFGGIAATGALARTATNVRAGATSPIASVVHALVVLLAILLLAPLVAYVPMASLAGLLLLTAWNMSEIRHFLHVVRSAPRSDVFVLIICFVLTVLADMVVAVSVGVVLAALLFMKRMAELTHARLIDRDSPETTRTLPDGVALYEIAGPLFFGAAQNAMGALATVGTRNRVVVLSLGQVPTMDATGMVALESALTRLRVAGKIAVIAGPLPQPRAVTKRALRALAHDHLRLAENLEEALAMAGELAQGHLVAGGTLDASNPVPLPRRADDERTP
jgi:SulP family sulfate permease